MAHRDDLFERLDAAIDGGNRIDMRVRELRACANVLEMHVAEETPDPEIVDDIHNLLTKLAMLRRVPEERRRELEAVLQEVRRFAFP